jgi:uncharacterized membrane protein (DUF441 family)
LTKIAKLVIIATIGTPVLDGNLQFSCQNFRIYKSLCIVACTIIVERGDMVNSGLLLIAVDPPFKMKLYLFTCINGQLYLA